MGAYSFAILIHEKQVFYSENVHLRLFNVPCNILGRELSHGEKLLTLVFLCNQFFFSFDINMNIISNGNSSK